MPEQPHDSFPNQDPGAASPSPPPDDESLLDAAKEALESLGSTLEVDPTSTQPQTLGPYRIVSLLGRGGMGTVYEAEQQFPRRAVALKVVRGGRYVDEHHIRLFQREAQTLARLKHPGVAAIYDAGRTQDGQHFFAMELVRGVLLSEHVRSKKLRLRDRLKLFCEICDAINYAHQRGVIHRDLKPSNILINAEGHPKVLDFGLAKITDMDIAVTTVVTAVGQLQGTVAYMSPEQSRGNPDEIDLRSDVYSLGVILYELVTDRLPYDVGHSMLHEAVRTICEDTPLRPSSINRMARGDLETIILKSLDKEPLRRYQNAAALKEDVERFLSNQPILARPPSALYQFRKLASRHKVGFAFVTALFVLIVGFGVWTRVLYVRAAAEAETAKEVSGFLVDLFKAPDPNVAWGKDTTAREILEQGAKKIETELKEQPGIRATLLDTLGTSYRNLAMYDPAVELFREALNLRRQELGERHLKVAEGMFLLGWALKQDEKYASAEQHLRKALNLYRELRGEDHEDVAKTLRLLGATLRDGGKYAEAEDLIRQALTIQRSLPGNQQAEISESLETLATVRFQQGDYQEAEDLLREALERRQEALRSGHPHHGSAQERMVPVMQAQGRYEEAEILARDVLAERLGTHKREHPYSAYALTVLGSLRRDQGDFAEAEQYVEEALTLYQKRFPDGHRWVTRCRNQLAWILVDAEDLRRAESLFRESLQTRRARSGDQTHGAADPKLGLAWIALERGNARRAEELAREAMNICKEVLPDGHWQVASAKNVLGASLAAQGRCEEAEPLLLQSHEAMEAIRGRYDRYVLKACRRVADGLERCGRTDQAEECRATLEAADGPADREKGAAP